ncbi:MAG: hypothetical protein LBL62_10550 [Planctomycetaceae bacterium]|jgi:WD40 repeat protein|nr:hypothetical protein [Planctomycetaceae bacterium]
MKLILILTNVFCLILCFPLFAEDRLWTDRAGKFQVEATLLDFDGKEVKLKKKEDGKIIALDLEKLSLPDQVYVKKTLESLGKSEESKPVEKNSVDTEKEPEPSPKKNSSRILRKPTIDDDEEDDDEEDDNDENRPAGKKFDGAFRGKIPATRISNARQIRVDLTKPGWSITPDAAPAALDFPLQPMVFPYRKQDVSTHVKMEGIGFAAESPEKILAALSFSSRGDTFATQVSIGNLKTLEIRSQIFPVRLFPLALSPDGSKALFIQETTEGRDKYKKHLTIADTTQPKFPCIAVFIPFAELKKDRGFDSEVDVEWAEWIDNEHLLVQSRSGRIVLLQTETGAAVWTLNVSNTRSVTLSPGKKYILACCRDRSSVHVLLETLSGKPLGQLQPSKDSKAPDSMTRFVFSPDGTKLAAYENGRVHLWDATNGTATESFYVGTISSYHRNLFWINPHYLLISGTLVDTRQQLPIWKYTDTQQEDVVFAGKYWHIKRPESSRSNNFAVLGLPLPHSTMPKLPLLPDSQKYVFRPGILVRLNIDTAIPDYEKVRSYIQNMLRMNGIKVADSGTISLNITLKAEPAKEIYYGDHFMITRNITGHANFTPHTMGYQLEQDGKILWETNFKTSPPSPINNEDLKNRSLQEVVNEKSKLTSYWYLSVEIPKKIPFDKAGTSSLIPTGRKY